MKGTPPKRNEDTEQKQWRHYENAMKTIRKRNGDTIKCNGDTTPT